MNITRVSVRFNEEEYKNFLSLKKQYHYLNQSQIIKQLMFRKIKPFLSLEERAILANYIYELNAIGRNINQLIKYKAFDDCKRVIADIESLVNEAKKVL